MMDRYKKERFFYSMVFEIGDKCIREAAEKFIKGRLIDIGCGHKPYKSILSKFVTEHIGVDHFETIHVKGSIDLFGTAYEIPVENETFDSALCTAVLEHLEEPGLAIKECRRVLRPGSYAIYTVPFIWHIHEAPRDFYRFSEFGLRYLFEKEKFEIIEIKPLSGFIVTFFQLHLCFLKDKVNRGPIKWLRLFDIYVLLINKLGLFLNRFDKSHIWTWCYIVVVKKQN